MILKECKVNWCSILEPNDKFVPSWQVQAELSEKHIKQLEKEYKEVQEKADISPLKKPNIKKDDKGIPFIVIKRKTTNAKGESNKRPAFKGTRKVNGELEDLNCLVGNGSVCNVQYDYYVWDNDYGKGVQLDFKGIQALDLVEYGVKDGDEFEEVDTSSDMEESSKSEEVFGDEDFDDEDFS